MARHALMLVLIMSQVFGTSPQNCTEDLMDVMWKFGTVLPQDSLGAMAVSSGKSINDLGDYSLCSDIPVAKYVLFSAYTSEAWIMSSGVSIGLCGPRSCSQADYMEILTAISQQPPLELFFNQVNVMKNAHFQARSTPVGQLEPLSIRITFPQDFAEENCNELSSGAISMLLVCIFLFILVALGTIIDVARRPSVNGRNKHVPMIEIAEQENKKQGSPEQREPDSDSTESAFANLLVCFSLYSNVPRLFAIKSESERQPLDCLNAVRVLSMLWIIYGHVCQFRLTVNPLKNFYEIYMKMKQVKYVFVYGAEFAVDTFFWMSGLLMAYLFLQQVSARAKSMGKREWAYAYFHRVFRILPAYVFILLCLWAFMRYLGDGPLWFQSEHLNSDCPDYWWTNFLFLNNFLPDGYGSMCLTHSWYLANDMQFFVLSLPVLYLYHQYSKAIGWLVLGLTCVTTVIVSILIADANEYKVVALAPENSTYYYYFYIKPYCRIAPYALGIACGMLLHSYNHWKRTGETYDSFGLIVAKSIEFRCVRYPCYLLGLVLINFFIFIHYDAYQDVDSGWKTWSQTENDLFLGFNHLGFALGLCLFLQPVLQGFNPFVNWFLSHSIWAPFARLTFCVYLVHLHLINAYFLNASTAYWVDDLNVATDLAFVLILSYSVATALTLLLESPCLALEKVLFHADKSKSG